jgi:hypothetical protein
MRYVVQAGHLQMVKAASGDSCQLGGWALNAATA